MGGLNKNDAQNKGGKDKKGEKKLFFGKQFFLLGIKKTRDA